MNGGHVHLAPVAFGFGPASHAVSIARAIRARRGDILVTGSSDPAAAGFLRSSGAFDAVTAAGLASGHSTPDVVVAVGDFDRAVEARRAGSSVVMVDALYWMWDCDPIPRGAVDRYLCLAFPGVADRIRANPYADDHTLIIPQILDTVPAGGARRDGVLLNLGGAVSPFGGNHRFLRALAEIVTDALDDDQEEDLWITCSTSAGKLLDGAKLPASATMVELSLPQMMHALANRRLLLTLPGLSIVWEAMAAGIPTIMLPGANYSHHRQPFAYLQHLASVPILTWDDLPGYAMLPPGLPEDVAVAEAIRLGERFADDRAARDSLTGLLRNAVRSGEARPPRLVGAGPWQSFDGAEHVAAEALALLDSPAGSDTPR